MVYCKEVYQEEGTAPKIIPFSVFRKRPLTQVEIVWSTDLFAEQVKFLVEQGEKNWQSPKAQINELLNLLPEELRLLQKTVRADDETTLREMMLAGLKHQYPELGEGCWVGLRTCFKEQPINHPWIMGIRTQEQIEDFFEPKKEAPTSWQGSKDHYHEWRREKDLTEILVLLNFPKLGLPKYNEDFFVFHVFLYKPSTFLSLPQMGVAFMPNTSQLRDLDRGTRMASNIYIEPRNEGYDSLAREQKLKISFGSNYVQDEQVMPEVEALAKRLGQTVFGEWCESFQLYSRLLALETVGLEALEFQGIKEGDQIKSMRLYGLRGVREYGPRFAL